MTPWAHLPNATHINALIGLIGEDLSIWNHISNPVSGVQWADVCNIVYTKIDNAEFNNIQSRLRMASHRRNSIHVRSCVEDAVVAMIAFDDCSHLLYSDPTEVEILANLGMPGATMMLGATKMFYHRQKEKTG